MHILINKKNLSLGNYRIKCALGKRGIKVKKKEGDLITPKGIYKIKNIFYRKDRVKNLKTNLKSFAISKSMGWCDDVRSNKYNRLINYPFKFSSEKLYKRDNTYDIVLVLDYNMNPVKKNAGSAIFLHISKKDFRSTKGCIAVKKTALLKIVKKIKKNTKIKIV